MSYQFLDETEHTFKLRHPDGTEFHVAKKAIGDAMLEKIRGMKPQKLAEGGTVEPEPTVTPPPMPTPTETPPPMPTPIPDLNAMANPTPSPLMTPPPTGHPVPGPAPTMGGEMIAQPDQQPAIQVPNMGNPLKGGMLASMEDIAAREKGAVGAKAGAEQQYNREAASGYQKMASDMEQMHANYQAQYDQLNKDHAQLMQDVAQSKIDPNRLWHDASTGGKIGAAIGMVLAGLGSGLTGGPNQAVGLFNRLIDRDIEAQRANLGKKQSLLQLNLQKTHSLQAAEAATRLQLSATLQGQLAASAAKAGIQTAGANAQLMNAQIDQQMLPMKMEMARWNMQQQFLNGPGGGGQIPEGMTDMIFDKDQRERLVNVQTQNGTRRVLAPDPETARKFREGEAQSMEMDTAIDRAIAHVKNHGFTIGTPVYDSDAQKLGNQLLGHIKMSMSKLHGLNRLSDTDLEQFEKMLPSDLGSMRSGAVVDQLNQLKEMNQAKRNAGYGELTQAYNPAPFQNFEGAPKR